MKRGFSPCSPYSRRGYHAPLDAPGLGGVAELVQPALLLGCESELLGQMLMPALALSLQPYIAIDGASHLRILDGLVSRLEEKRGMPIGSTRFFVMVGTADAYHRLYEIAHAIDRNAALMLGSEDLAADCEMLATPETLLNYKQQMIVAAKSAGIMPLGYIDSVAGLGDWERFRLMVRREFGYMGAVCVHPMQVTIANEDQNRLARSAPQIRYRRGGAERRRRSAVTCCSHASCRAVASRPPRCAAVRGPGMRDGARRRGSHRRRHQ